MLERYLTKGRKFAILLASVSQKYIDMLVAGVHPLVLRRRKVFRMRTNRGRANLLASVALAVLFVASFAYGLHRIDLRYAEQSAIENLPDGTPSDAVQPSTLEALSLAFNDLLGIPTANAAEFNYAKYRGAMVGSMPVVEAAPGQTVTVDVPFKNLGSATWSPEGRAYISAYAISPRYHASVFRSKDWLSTSHPAKILTPSVKTGQTGILRMSLTAPTKEGTYSDSFQLAAENTAWMWGAWVKVTVRVKSSLASAAPVVSSPSVSTPASSVTATTPIASAPVAAPTETSAVPAVKALLVFRSAERFEAPGGMEFSAHMIIKNQGPTSWKRWGLKLVSASSADGKDVDVDEPAWAASDLAIMKDAVIPPNQNADFIFPFTIPDKSGNYTFRFAFVADGGVWDGGSIDFPVRVISDVAPIIPIAPAPSSPSAPSSPTSLAVTPSPTGDPIVRIGLFTTEKFEELTSNSAFEARSAEGSLLASFAPGTRVQFRYDAAARLYRLTDGISEKTSATPICFSSANASAVFTVLSYENRPGWNSSLNDNMFRGTLELRKNDRNEYVWLIDELGIESYLHGLAETSNASPVEFQKALAVAARSYAYWHLTHPGKHWHFTVDATYDQVYKGYGAEIRTSRFVSAVDSTRGQIVIYNGDNVITPYYTWSDGRTRAWTEVWGGAAKPWLVSVPAIYDLAAGRTLFGHGVGMSAWDAIGRANAGEMYDVILKYYYSGTGLKTAY